MASARDVMIFFAGAECFHAISHGILYWMKIPMDVGFMVVTPTLNFWSMAINGAIGLGLLWWASRAPS